MWFLEQESSHVSRAGGCCAAFFSVTTDLIPGFGDHNGFDGTVSESLPGLALQVVFQQQWSDSQP
jgi:hypothetical protein